MRKLKTRKYAEIVRKVAEVCGDERSSKCGYDLLNGVEAGDVDDRAKAWERHVDEHIAKGSHTDTERDGCWVPAIPLS